MPAQTLAVKDANNITQTLSVATDATNGGALIGATQISDPATGSKATVAQFHNADNQTLPATAFGILGGGVAQLLNAAGNLDRQREIGLDNIPPTGITSGGANFAMQFKTAASTGIAAAGTATITLGAVSGSINGVPWAVKPGSVLIVDTGAAQESVLVTAVNAAARTVTASFAGPHAQPFNITGFTYNQERDAAGENDGASGSGTAVAAEYAYNGGAPGNANFDRARSVQGKGRATAAITAGGGQGSTAFTIAAAGALQPGMQILAYDGAFPAAGHFEALYVDLSYVPGSATVPLTTATVNATTYTTIAYDAFAATGPGLNGFNVTGIGLEEEALYDPVSGLFYLERAATQDSMPAPNIVAEGPALFNGATMDRARGNIDTAALVALTAAGAGTAVSPDQTNVNGRGLQLGVNIAALTGTAPTVTVTVQGKDAASGQYYTLLQSAALAATGFTLLTLYPGAPATANVATPQVLPRTWRVSVTVAGTTPSATATIGASVIV